MEAVKNTVTQAIWGKTEAEETTTHNQTAGQEPVSGVTGAGNADEPFDKGNAEAGEVKPVTSTLPDRTQSSTIDPESSSSPTTLLGAKTDMERNQPAITDPKTSGTADSTGANVDTTNVKIGSTPKPGDVQDGTEDAVKRAESGQRISDEEREQLAEAGKLPKDPNDHSGEPMKMHGESKLGDDLGEDSLDGAAKKERAKSVSHEGGGEHGKEQGTGTQYVKSSGLAAEGGDFDASNPGAGREATRLLEEKGVKRDGDNHGKREMPAGTGEKPAHKSSTMDKIKDKLHIGTGKHV